MSNVNSLIHDLLSESSDELRDVPNNQSGDGADQEAQNRRALDNPDVNMDNTDVFSEENKETDVDDDSDVFNENDEEELPDPEESEALDEDYQNLLSMDTMYLILSEDMSHEALQEARNIVRLNKRTRLNNLTTRTALVMARRKKDPLFAKYAKFNTLRLGLRARIVKKYGSRAMSYSRKLMSRTSTAVTNATQKK
ncbi:hypothetical protein [Proteus mirabilis]|uniref:hypothetical protein n=1 Tax=Proteus mirabilis TaxID=584 RepID=UPI0034D5C3E4